MDLETLDRSAVLQALWITDLATPEMIQLVRLATQDMIIQQLYLIHAPASVIEAAGGVYVDIPPVPPYPKDREILTKVLAHLAALDRYPIEIEYIDTIWQAGKKLGDKAWIRLAGTPPVWSRDIFPSTPARLFNHAQDPAWQPLIDMMSHGVYCFGPTADTTKFMVVKNYGKE